MGRNIFQILFCLGASLLLAACSSGPEICEIQYQTEGKTLAPKKATSRPYKVNGNWYYPQPHYEYEEEGLASFYGGGDVFHGRPTATGERFDMNGLTAAHKTVPLPCMAKVTNLENGRELVVKVNDRGPFPPGRLLDVSRRAAQLLGFENKGLAKVRVVTLVPESLALNGIDPSTVMMAESTVPTATSSAVAPPTPIKTAKLPDPDTLFEALGTTSTEDEEVPAPLMMAETPTLPEPAISAETAPLPEPTMMAEALTPSEPAIADTTPQSEPIMLAEAPLPTNLADPSPLPVKLEAPASTGIFVYVGEYETQAKAQSLSQSLEGFSSSPIGIIKNNGPKPYAATLGPLPSMSHANQILDQLIQAGHLISRIVIQR